MLLATNAYCPLAIRFIKKFIYYYTGSCDVFFYYCGDENPYQYLSVKECKKVTPVFTRHGAWPSATNDKFNKMLSISKSEHDYLYYFDADTNINAPFSEEWFIGDTVAAEHFENRIGMKNFKPYDNFIKSSCYVDPSSLLDRQYYQGAFFGGKKQNIINMCKYLISLQKQNQEIKHEPPWNDESYLNFYFHYHPPKKMIKAEDFKFVVSDKGSIDNTRNPQLNISPLKEQMKDLKDFVYEIKGYKLSPLRDKN